MIARIDPIPCSLESILHQSPEGRKGGVDWLISGKRLPVSFLDKALLNGRNIVETIIGHIKEFSSLRLPKHRSVFNAFTHLTAALVAYQINPLPPKPIAAFIP